MDWYLIVKVIHIISSTVLFGTGMGIAFFMLCSHFTDNLDQKFFAARFTVFADYIFTLPAVIIQPLSGVWLVHQGGYEYFEWWLTATYVLYVVAGFCWLPVVWIQIQLRQMLAHATGQSTALPARYHRLFRIWFWLGFPAFGAIITIFILMVFKPV